MQAFLVVGNLKMNLLSERDSERYVGDLEKAVVGKHFEHAQCVVAPPAPYLHRFKNLPRPITLAAQDMHWEKQGAYTGSLSPLMLKDAGATHVIVGHSERLALGETQAMVRAKVDAALAHNLVPIVCIGESLPERERGETTDVIAAALEHLFRDQTPLLSERLVLAYEPRWAIGTGRTPTTSEIFQVRVFIRKWFTEAGSSKLAERVRVLYGGSVNSQNVGEVSWESEMDGVLVGSESRFPRELVKMMELAENHFKTV